MDGVLEGVGHGANKLIRDAIGTGRFVTPKLGDNGIKGMAAEDVWKSGRGVVRRGVCVQRKGVRSSREKPRVSGVRRGAHRSRPSVGKIAVGVRSHSRRVGKERAGGRVKKCIEIRRYRKIISRSEDAAVGQARGCEQERGQAAVMTGGVRVGCKSSADAGADRSQRDMSNLQPRDPEGAVVRGGEGRKKVGGGAYASHT
jgi:hypothetical protein